MFAVKVVFLFQFILLNFSFAADVLSIGAVPAFVDILKVGNNQEKIIALDSLIEVGKAAQAAMPIVVELTDSEIPDVRARAVSAVGAIGAEERNTVFLLIRKFESKHEKEDVVLRAMNALLNLGHIRKKAFPQLIKMLKDPRRSVRLTAARVISIVAPMAPHARDIWRDELLSINVRERTAAAQALARMRSDASSTLMDLMESYWGLSDLPHSGNELNVAQREILRAIKEIGPEPLLIELSEVARNAADAASRLSAQRSIEVLTQTSAEAVAEIAACERALAEQLQE